MDRPKQTRCGWRDLHRNPIDHPEEFLELAEALEVFNAASVAISKMARQITALKTSQTP
jgi:hypothetical protein